MANEGDVILYVIKVIGLLAAFWAGGTILLLVATYFLDAYLFKEIRNNENEKD